MPTHHLDNDSPSPGDSRRLGPANAHRREAVDYHGFEALYRENRALLEEVEAKKREEKPRKSMFKRGVETLLSVPDGQPIFPGFKAGAAKVGSLFAIEGPFRKQVSFFCAFRFYLRCRKYWASIFGITAVSAYWA